MCAPQKVLTRRRRRSPGRAGNQGTYTDSTVLGYSGRPPGFPADGSRRFPEAGLAWRGCPDEKGFGECSRALFAGPGARSAGKLDPVSARAASGSAAVTNRFGRRWGLALRLLAAGEWRPVFLASLALAARVESWRGAGPEGRAGTAPLFATRRNALRVSLPSISVRRRVGVRSRRPFSFGCTRRRGWSISRRGALPPARAPSVAARLQGGAPEVYLVQFGGAKQTAKKGNQQKSTHPPKKGSNQLRRLWNALSHNPVFSLGGLSVQSNGTPSRTFHVFARAQQRHRAAGAHSPALPALPANVKMH